MSELIHLTERDGLGRDVHYLSVPNIGSVPSEFDIPAKKLVIFVAWDADELSVGEISDWAERMLDIGAVYICAWGKDCERVHDIIDEVYVGREIETGGELPFVLTTWHNEDTLEEAIWFALNCADPAEDSQDSSISTLILNVNDGARDVFLRNILSDLQKLDDAGRKNSLQPTINVC